MQKLPTFLLPALLVLLICASVFAAKIDERRFSLQIDLGGAQPALNDSAQVWAMRPAIGGSLQYMVSPQIGFIFSAMTTDIYNDTTGSSVFQTNKRNADQKWLIRSAAIGAKFYLQRRGGASPYIMTTVDFLKWRVLQIPNGHYVRVDDGSGVQTNYTATELGGTIGLGIEKLFWQRVGLCAGISVTYLSGIGTDFADWVTESRSRALLRLSASLTFNLGFGGRKGTEEQKRPELEQKIQTSEETGAEDVQPDTTKTIEPPMPEDSVETAPADEDHDGVVDYLDRCPYTAAGALVDSLGCPMDSDSDGVYDGLDQCDDTSPEARASVDTVGCPLDSDLDGIPDYRDKCPESAAGRTVDSLGCVADGDKDGVPDDLDRCPETPGGVDVDSSGCPDLSNLFAKRIIGSLFKPGGTVIVNEQKAVLDSVASLMKLFSDVTAVVKGYTDNIGPADANAELSGKRARAVMKYLTGKGVAASRLNAVGLGETNFIASNKNRAGREKNRRVEIEFSYPALDR